MRSVCGTLIAICLVACCSMAQDRSHVVMSEKTQKLRTIYLKIRGPEEAATKLRASFAEAVAGKDLFLADDPHQAGSKVDVTIKERNLERPFYAELTSATLMARDGKSTAVSSCNKVTDGKGYSAITTKAGTSDLMKDVPAKSTIYLEEGSQPAALIQTLQKQIREAGFTIVTVEKDADFRLKDIHLTRTPLRAAGMEATVQSMIHAAGGLELNLTSNVTTRVSILEPIASEAESCRSTVQRVAENGPVSYKGVALADVAMIERFIR